MSKILFISGSLGMGHVTRDLAIVRAFRTLEPNAEIVWLAGEPAVSVLKEAGEKLLPEAIDYNLDTETVSSLSSNFKLNLANHLLLSGTTWKEAYKKNNQIVIKLGKR